MTYFLFVGTSCAARTGILMLLDSGIILLGSLARQLTWVRESLSAGQPLTLTH